MARIKLPLPEIVHFNTQLTLRVYDLNYGAHMGNDSVLSIVHEARLRFLKSLNITERDFYNCSLLMSDSAVVYKREAFYGDVLSINVTVSELYEYGFELFYSINNIKSNFEVARVKTGIVCFSHIEKKIQKLPLEFKDTFS